MRKEIELPYRPEEQQLLFGTNDRNLRLLREKFGLKIITRGEILLLDGEVKAVNRTSSILNRIIRKIENGQKDISKLLEIIIADTSNGTSALAIRTERGIIEAKTEGQQEYIRAIRDNGLVFAVGPAGTGKTFLATACAVEALRRDEVQRIILTRPAVEAGESLGFLPGDLKEKVDPYLRPIYDALSDMLGRRQMAHYIDTAAIEIAPLAFMRGRTLNNAFVILDEAQNTLPSQMKMLLTRLGKNSKCVVTGDITQVDLSDPARCGLIHATNILQNITGVSIINLKSSDIVRHRLVADIVRAYDNYEAREKEKKEIVPEAENRYSQR